MNADTRAFICWLHRSVSEAYLAYAVEYPGEDLVPPTRDAQIRMAERLTLFANRRPPIVNGKLVLL